MSSRFSKRKGGGLRFPAPWGEWVWSEQYQRYYRSRLKGPEDWEYEYDQPEDRPRTITSFGPDDLKAPPPSQYPSSSDYRAAHDSEIDDVTQELSQSTLEEHGPEESWRTPTATYPSATSPGSCSSTATYPSAATYPSSASTGEYSASASSASYTSTSSYGQASYPPPSQGWQSHIKTEDPSTLREEFDPHYKVHSAWQFKWGKIFKVLWAEPKGAEGAGSAGQSGSESLTVRKGPGGKETFAKVRRFVIIKPMGGYCICLPILTYSGQGVNKRGVHAHHHAIIFSGKKPVAFRGEKEKGLTMRSIKVASDNPRHKLDDASRLNYAKTYAVEYNVKVWFIGKVSSDSQWQISSDYNRIHPPLEIKSVRPPGTPDDTYGSATATPNYAIGGGSSTYPGSSTYYGSAYAMGSKNTRCYDSGSSDSPKTSYGDQSVSSGSSYPSTTLYSPSGSSYNSRDYYGGSYEAQVLLNGMDHGGFSSSGYTEHSSKRKKSKYLGEGGYFEESPETDDVPQEPEEPVERNGDPLHDGDPDDNGDQGDQDRGGGQRRFERHSRDSRRRR